MPDGDLGEHLPVEQNIVGLQVVHKLGIGKPGFATCRVYADDPEPPEIALAISTIPERIRARMYDGFLGSLVPVPSRAPIALGFGDDLFMSCSSSCSSCNASHFLSSFLRLCASG